MVEVRVQGLTEEHKRLATPQINFCGLSSQNRGWLQTGVNGVCVQAPRAAFTRLSRSTLVEPLSCPILSLAGPIAELIDLIPINSAVTCSI